MNAEKQVAGPAAASGDLVEQLGRIAQEMGLDATAEQSDEAFGFGPVKPGFTREAGSFRRQVPLPMGSGNPGE
ncbi:MAG: hypothetical protein M3313_01000 [Actinomycetota bacterium]|nr:hypothetical protein [Actinomycetota bacterium]